MKYDPCKHHRCSSRLRGHDYSQPGWYFVTMYTKNREILFGDVEDGEMVLNSGGARLQKENGRKQKKSEKVS